MGTDTDMVGKEIFETDKGKNMGEQNNTNPSAPDIKEFGDLVPNTPPNPPKDAGFKDPKGGPRKPFQGSLLAGLLVIVFLISSASGLFIIFSGGIGGKVQVEPKKESASVLPKISGPSEPGAVVIKIKGVITESQSASWREPSSASAIAKKIRQAADKENVKAIILDINSPGGTVAAVQDIYNAIMYARNKKGKKTIALFRDVAASGGFYVAMACDKVIAQPGTLTGSIGVIMQTNNLEGLMGKVGVKFNAIKSGKHKDMGAPYRALTEEEKTLFQELVDDTYAQFFEVVQTARPNINPAELKVYADGRVFTGRKAFSIGLIDALGGEEEALALAGEMTGIKDIKVITFRADSFKDWIMGMEASTTTKGLESKIEDLATPKVAYLWTM